MNSSKECDKSRLDRTQVVCYLTCNVMRVSCAEAGVMLAMKTVLELPPRLSLSMRVSFESRKRMCLVRLQTHNQHSTLMSCHPSDKSHITAPSVVSDWLIEVVSWKRS